MEIDVILDARSDHRRLAELGALAEQAGIQTVWVSSLLDSREPFANFALLAERTARIGMGAIAVNPYDTHPVRLAASLLTLNEMSEGRARIVVGGGGEALQALAIEPTKRVRAVRECIEIIKEAATREEVNYAGGLFTVQHLRLGWLESPPPPVYAAANQEQMLRMAAKTADGVMVSDLPASLAKAPLDTLRARRAELGMEDKYWSNVFTAWHVYEGAQAAYAEARRWLFLRGIFRPWILETLLEPGEVELVMAHRDDFFSSFRSQSDEVAGVPRSILDKLVEGLTLAGSVADIDRLIEELQRYAATGFSAVALRLYHQPEESLRLIGDRILPALRNL